MNALLTLYLSPFLVFVLILTRLSGLALTAPVFGSRNAPMQVRALLAIGIAMLITPLYWQTPISPPQNVLQLLVLVAGEAVIGLALGMGVMLLFSSMQIAGHMIGQMAGMQLADVFDPELRTQVPLFAQLLDAVALAVFLTLGGHRQVMDALLETFAWLPPGQLEALPKELAPAMAEVMQVALITSIRLAAPVVAALMVSMLVMGFISRTLPQLNVFVIGFNLNAFVLLATLSICLGSMVWAFEDQVASVIELVGTALLHDVVP